jgi:excisionase family DNA binding protein
LVLTVEEAAELLSIGRGTAYAAVRVKQIPSLKFGRRILVPLGALEKLLGDNQHADYLFQHSVP